MSVKGEVEKLLARERAKLVAQDQAWRDFSSTQGSRFAPMSSVVTELAESVPPEFIRLKIHSASATLEVGTRGDKDDFQCDIRWTVAPNSSSELVSGSFRPQDRPGFKIDETQYARLPEFEITEKELEFPSESAAAEHMAERLAKKVAWYQHLAEKHRTRKSS